MARINWSGTQTSWDGTNTWGGEIGLPASVITQRNIIGDGVPKRQACFELWSVNSTTLVFETQLPLRVKGGYRKIDARQRMQRDDLQFLVQDPTGRYVSGGDLAQYVDLNSLIGLKWTVTSDASGTVTAHGNVYRIVDPMDYGRDMRGGSPFQIDAEDWLRARLENEVAAYSGFSTPFRDAIRLKTDMVAAGCPVIGNTNTWATVAAAILYYLAGNRLRVTGDWTSGEHPTSEDDLDALFDPLTVAVLNQPPSWWNAFDYIAWLGRLQARYDGDGYPHVFESRARTSSGLVISCNPEITSVIDLPWEEPINRQISRPEFSFIRAYITYVVEDTTPPVVNLDFLAQKTSNALQNPYLPPASRDRIEVASIAQGNVVPFANLETATAYCDDALQKVLSDADVLTVPIDSAFPIGDYVMQDVLIYLDDPDIKGEFTIREVNQPLTEQPSTVTMNWARDVI